MDGWMDVWMDRWMGRWMGRWVEWTHRKIDIDRLML
jgi:hypothetical protein